MLTEDDEWDWKVREIKRMDQDLIKSYHAQDFPQEFIQKLPSNTEIEKFEEKNNTNLRQLQISGSVAENPTHVPSLLRNEPNRIHQNSSHETDPKRFSLK